MSEIFYKNQMVFLGIDPHYPLRKWLIVTNLTLMSVLVCLTLYNFYLNKSLIVVESFSYYFVMVVKHLTIVLGRRLLKKLLKEQERFWKPYTTDEIVAFLQEHAIFVKKAYIFISTVAIIIFALPTLFTKNSVYSCYIPPQIPFPVYCVAEFYFLAVSASTVISYNTLICSLIVDVVVQFRMLNLKIVEINFGAVTNNEELRKCRKDLGGKIKHQQFLIRYVKDLNKLITAPVALLMVLSVSLICMYMYILSTSNGTLMDQSRAIISSMALVTEFFLVYGLPAQILMDESSRTADVIYYECEWYLPILRPLRKDFSLMIARSQNSICISAGDYYVVNNRTIVLMLKTAYSFFSFLQGVTNE